MTDICKKLLIISAIISSMLCAYAKPSPEADFAAASLEDVKGAAGDKSVAIIDARPSVFYELGHIDGALSLPVIEFDDIFEKFYKEAGLEKFGKIIVYCSDSGCEDSLLLAKKLREKGVKNIFIYKGGWADWRNSAAKG